MTIFRAILFFCLRFSAIPWVLRHSVQKRRVTILTYHKVSPKRFERHVKTLARFYSVIPLKKYLDARDQKGELPERALVITFDDGHKENYQLLPVIRKYRVPVTIFVCTSIIGTSRKFWFNTIVLSQSNAGLKSMSDQQRLEVLSQAGFQETKEYGQREALSDTEVNEMKEFVDFQAHTRFHVNLPKATDARAQDEIMLSKKELESKLGRPAYALAYPDGDYCPRDQQLLQKNGYRLGLSCEGYYNTVKTDAYALRRLSLRDQSCVNEALVRASGLWAFIHKFFFGQKHGFNNKHA